MNNNEFVNNNTEKECLQQLREGTINSINFFKVALKSNIIEILNLGYIPEIDIKK